MHHYGLYALPSLVDSATTISNNIGHLLLEGPLLTSHVDETNNKVPLPGYYVFIANNGYQSFENTKSMLGNMQIIVVCICCI